MWSLALALCIVTFSSAQSDFRFRNYTINDGLSQSGVTCIIQDELSSIWIGTQDGLNRYDGNNFEQFFADNTKGLENNHIRCSGVDSKGNLWFGTNDGLSNYNLYTEEFKTFRPGGSNAFQIEDITIDQYNKVWIATPESGLYSFDISTKKFLAHNELIKSKKTNDVQELSGGRIAISTLDKGVIIYHPESGRVEQIPLITEDGTPFIVNGFFPFDERSFGISTNIGVYTINSFSLELTDLFPSLISRYGPQNVSDVFLHSQIGWFVATNGNGLFTIHDNGKIVHSTSDIFQKNSILFNELVDIFQDNGGTLWLSSRRGVSTFNPQHGGFMGVGPSGNPAKGLSDPSVWSFAESPDGKLFFVGTDNAVTRYDRDREHYTQFVRTIDDKEKSLGEQAILSVQVIHANLLLVGCADGFYELQIGEGFYDFREVDLGKDNKKFTQTRVYSIVKYDNDRFFLATRDGVILYNWKKRRSVYFEHNSSMPNRTISKGICRLAYKDKNNRYWFATSTGGLNILSEREGNLEIRPYEYNAILKEETSDYIASIYHDGNGVYWLGSSGSGLIKWNERAKTAEVFDKSKGLPNDVIYGVLKDRNNKLWLSTNRGICSFDIRTKKVRSYSEVDGLMSNEFNLGAYFHSEFTNEFYFGSINGFNHFAPEQIKNYKNDVQVVFTRFKLENEWLKPGQKDSPLAEPIFKTNEIVLGYNQRSFTIRFQGSDFSNPDLLNYKYILVGSDEGEVLIEGMNEIHFNSLAHGDYVLKVFARIGEGPWSTFPAQIRIRILPPFWLTWWFWSIIALLLMVSIRIFVRKRIDASRREQVRLEMKVRERTKEIEQKNREIEQKNREIEAEKNKVIKQQTLLQKEKDKTEKILKSVIPESTAEELKKSGRARARAYSTVSVLFTDFVGFTKISERMNPTELVKKLDVYFTKFDHIIVENSLEKIKTIGDSYMCAGGVPVRNKTNPIDACLAALQIQAYMKQRKDDAIANNEEFWELRLGINTGEVTAGVIGSERLAYDIWGSTVNQASRMEMLGEPGKVTISGATYAHIEPYFDVTFKGKAQTKSRGVIDMYCVERIKPELSLRGEGIYPNNRFQEIVNLHHYSSINYYKAERHIMKLLEQKLSKNLHYHSIAHTKDVVNAVERIALLEGVTDEGLFLLKSAATYHDAGFIEQYDKNEPIGVRLAQEILPKYGYTQEHIDRIKELIYVTMIPHNPKNNLEEIICDADLDYLGREDFHIIADKLRIELKQHGKIDSDRKWDEIQLGFLQSHRYFTNTAKTLRNEKKASNLEEVKKRIERNEYRD